MTETDRAGEVEVLAGKDAPRGLPHPSDLSCGLRLMIAGSAATDLAMRTLGGSLIATSVSPWAIGTFARGQIGREREALDFYHELTEAADASRSFPRPDREVEVTAQRARRLSSFRPNDGQVEVLRFTSPFVPLNPALRDGYAKFRNNQVACAQYWRHDDGPRPTLCVIHGFMASPYWVNSAFFSLPWFYGHGYDVLLYTLPFHGTRRSRLSPYSGHGLFAHGVAHINEAIGQGVHDFRLFVDYLEARGVDRIGLTGISLGGYMTALLAAVEDRLHFAIPNVPVTDMPKLGNEWAPAAQVINTILRLGRVPRDEFDKALAFHSPLTYPPILPKDRLFIIVGLGDRLAPPSQSERLWEHWGHCTLHWFPGNHSLHVNRAAYLKRMGRFMQATGFSYETPAAAAASV